MPSIPARPEPARSPLELLLPRPAQGEARRAGAIGKAYAFLVELADAPTANTTTPTSSAPLAATHIAREGSTDARST